MKTSLKSFTKTWLVAAVLIPAALSSYAQSNSASPAPVPMPMQHQRGAHERMDPTQRLGELKTKLKITADQEGAWASFASAMKPPARPVHPDMAAMENLTTPERIDKMRVLRAQHMTERQAQQEKREDAVKAFYATLNAEQKKTMDTTHAQFMKRHGAPHKGMGSGQ